MPKRSAEEKLERYRRKIRKIEEKSKPQRRRIIRQIIDSSEDEENRTDTITEEPTIGPDARDEGVLVEQLRPDEPERPPPAPVLESEPPTEDGALVTPAEDTPEVTLDPDLLSALGASTSDTPDFGDPIHESLANLWLPLLRKGLSKEDKTNLLKEYLVPSNCKLLQAPKLNPEISAAVAEVVRNRDKKIEAFQQALGASTSAVNRAMDTLLKTDNKITALKALSDGCRLLSDLHFSFSADRKRLIMPSLEKKFLHVIQDAERDDTLFGTALGEKIKASKAIERQGQQIRKPTNFNTKPASSFQAPTVRTHQGNWTGPPRYPSNRGGRGGLRKPPASSARRPYNLSSTPQPAPKNQGQNKSRADAHL